VRELLAWAGNGMKVHELLARAAGKGKEGA
jgi:hypothetical protein